MKNIYIFLFFYFVIQIYCIEEEQEDGNILLKMSGKKIDINLKGDKITNKHYYTVPLKIGTPPKIFDVQIDTSSSTSWLPSIKCKNCKYSKNFYDESQSSTSYNVKGEEIELEDEDGDLEGYQINDNIELNGYKLTNFSFVQATELDDDFKDHFDGKLGLGYRGKSKNFSFLDRLKNDGLISKKIFSINQVNETKGYLYIGDITAKHYDYCNVSLVEDLDDIYKESWICDLTHAGIFQGKKGISKHLTDYTVISNGKVDFDSAYEYIAVPIHYRSLIEELLHKANLNCETNENEIKAMKEQKKDKKGLKYNYNDEEISIKCKISQNELHKKDLVFSFVLQGKVYSLPLHSLFFSDEVDGKLEMKIKYIDDDDAIWTFGYPFMSQFLMIFNMEKNHVGIKTIPKSSISIVNLAKEWNDWNEVANNFFYKKIDITAIIIIASILFTILIIIVVVLVWRSYKKTNTNEQNNKVIELQKI